MTITYEDMLTICPRGDKALLRAFVDSFNQNAEEFGLTTDLRKAHFIAQVAHESDSFKTTVEYGRGKGKRYYPYYGRGLIQTTWQENYAEFYTWCVNRNLSPREFFREKYIEDVAQLPWALYCAYWYWDSRKLNKWADEDNVREITRRVNGGYNGLQDRINYLNKAKAALKLKKTAVDTNEGSIVKVKFTVREVQEALVKNGMNIDVDGKMGNQTVTAVKLYQKLNGLVPDGIIGPKTAEKLFA